MCKKKDEKKNNILPFQSVKIYLHSDISADCLCVYLSIFVVQWSAAAVRHFAGKKKRNKIFVKKRRRKFLKYIKSACIIMFFWLETKLNHKSQLIIYKNMNLFQMFNTISTGIKSFDLFFNMQSLSCTTKEGFSYHRYY